MDKRIGWPATTISVCAGIVLALYEVVAEWTMPIGLAKTLLGITALAGFIAVIWFCHNIWVWARPSWQRYALRFPIYDKTKPNPLQWLIDIAEKQRDNPYTHIVLTDCIWFSYNAGEASPCLRIKIYFKNLSIYNLVVGMPEGRVIYKGEELPNPIPKVSGGCNVVPGGDIIFDLSIYIPDKFKEDICSETGSSTKEIRNLSLGGLRSEVKIKDDAKIALWNIASQKSKLVIRPNG